MNDYFNQMLQDQLGRYCVFAATAATDNTTANTSTNKTPMARIMPPHDEYNKLERSAKTAISL